MEQAGGLSNSGTQEQQASRIHRLIEVGKMCKLEMGRVLLTLMADSGTIDIPPLKRKIKSLVNLDDPEVRRVLEHRMQNPKVIQIPKPPEQAISPDD